MNWVHFDWSGYSEINTQNHGEYEKRQIISLEMERKIAPKAEIETAPNLLSKDEREVSLPLVLIDIFCDVYIKLCRKI